MQNTLTTTTTNTTDDLTAWVHWALRPARRGQHRVHETSYALKHRAENQLGRYVSEEEFKRAMLGAGYLPVDSSARSWEFRVAWAQPEEALGHPW